MAGFNRTLQSIIWSTSPTSGMSLLVENGGTEQQRGLFMLLELSGEVQSCIYHLCWCHPQLINCISCQWRTLKVTAEIKKNKNNLPPVKWWHILPAGMFLIILIIWNVGNFDDSSSGHQMWVWWHLLTCYRLSTWERSSRHGDMHALT